MAAKRKKAAKVERISKRGRGRPPKFASAAEFIKKAAEYFRFCDTRLVEIEVEEGEQPKAIRRPAPYTIESLIDYCDIHNDTLNGWERGDLGEEFSVAVKDCKRKIRAQWSQRLQDSKNPAGVIFYGKAALGYRDVQVVEQSGPGGKPVETKVTIEVVYPQSRRELANEQASAAITTGK